MPPLLLVPESRSAGRSGRLSPTSGCSPGRTHTTDLKATDLGNYPRFGIRKRITRFAGDPSRFAESDRLQGRPSNADIGKRKRLGNRLSKPYQLGRAYRHGHFSEIRRETGNWPTCLFQSGRLIFNVGMEAYSCSETTTTARSSMVQK